MKNLNRIDKMMIGLGALLLAIVITFAVMIANIPPSPSLGTEIGTFIRDINEAANDTTPKP